MLFHTLLHTGFSTVILHKLIHFSLEDATVVNEPFKCFSNCAVSAKTTFRLCTLVHIVTFDYTGSLLHSNVFYADQ